MARRMVVADAGPLIIWARLGRLDLLRAVCVEVWVPKVVEREATNDPRRPGAAAILTAFTAETLVRPSPKIEAADATPFPTLGAGESAAIRLAIQMQCPVVMDEKRGRSIAKAQHVAVIGTLGIFVIRKTSRPYRSDQTHSRANGANELFRFSCSARGRDESEWRAIGRVGIPMALGLMSMRFLRLASPNGKQNKPWAAQ